jgi:hypothetical protein
MEAVLELKRTATVTKSAYPSLVNSLNIVDIALNSDFTDFEDGLQYFTSKEHNVFIMYAKIMEMCVAS